MNFSERTFLRRRGRMTQGQRRALDSLSDRYCLDASGRQPVDSEVFGREAPLGLEIGFGMGHALLAWAQQAPDWNLVGIEVYQPGIGALLLGVERLELQNVRVIEASAEPALESLFSPDSLDEVRVFFPDPWPKKRHHKRRLVQTEFLSVLGSRLKPGGKLLLATDWKPYAEWMRSVLDAHPLFRSAVDGGFAPRPEARPVTNFEARGQRLGHAVWDLDYRCRS